MRDPETTAGGIIIPDIAKEKCDQGIVKYIGPDVRDIKIGDWVLFGGYDGTLIQLEDEGTLIILREPFIKSVINPGVDPSIPGLFFRAKPTIDLRQTLKEFIEAKFYGVGIGENVADIILMGIMTRVSNYINDLYFSATYEMAVDLISDFWSNDPIAKSLHPKNKIDDREVERPLEEEENVH